MLSIFSCACWLSVCLLWKEKKKSIQIFRLFSNWIVCFFDAELNEFFIYFGYWLPGSSDSKESACNVGNLASIPGSGRSPGEGNGNPLQYSCLENPMDRGAWWATYSPWGFRVGHDQSDLACTHAGMKTNYYLKVQMK